MEGKGREGKGVSLCPEGLRASRKEERKLRKSVIGENKRGES